MRTAPAADLATWPMREAQRQAVHARALHRGLAEGSHLYFLVKRGATRGVRVPQMAASMTGLTPHENRDMVLRPGT